MNQDLSMWLKPTGESSANSHFVDSSLHIFTYFECSPHVIATVTCRFWSCSKQTFPLDLSSRGLGVFKRKNLEIQWALGF